MVEGRIGRVPAGYGTFRSGRWLRDAEWVMLSCQRTFRGEARGVAPIYLAVVRDGVVGRAPKMENAVFEVGMREIFLFFRFEVVSFERLKCAPKGRMDERRGMEDAEKKLLPRMRHGFARMKFKSIAYGVGPENSGVGRGNHGVGLVCGFNAPKTRTSQ
jgi:hypothetical protein